MATIAEISQQIADAIMDAIEKRRGIIKDDLTETARGVLAKNQTGSSQYLPHRGLMEKATIRNLFDDAFANGVIHIASSEPCAHVALSAGSLPSDQHQPNVSRVTLDSAMADMIAYGNSMTRVHSDGSVEHVKASDWNDADDGTIWSKPNGSP